MPHVTLHALEHELAGREPDLIRELTASVVSVYGEWARSAVEVRLVGIPAGRWARGGVAVATAGPTVTFGMREEVFARADAAEVVAQLVGAFTQAVCSVFGDECRDDVLVELVGQPISRSGLGGEVISGHRRRLSEAHVMPQAAIRAEFDMARARKPARRSRAGFR